MKNNYFEFNTKVKQQLAETAMGKFAPQCACIFMDHVDTLFPESQVYKWLVWFQYIDNVFFIWTHGQESLSLFLEDLSKCHPIIQVHP